MYFSRLFTRTSLVALLLGLIAACGGGSEVPPVGNLPVLNAAPNQTGNSNVLPVFVDSGPAGTGYNVNRLYTSVTICESGRTDRCQTIDHVLVDTGSTGLRLLASELSPDFQLNRTKVVSGSPLLNCVQFVDNTYAWGSVATADVLLGDKRANGVPIQVIGDPVSDRTADACGDPLDAITKVVDLGAKGILGVDLRQRDCGTDCLDSSVNGSYFVCTDPGCTAVVGSKVALVRQVSNPVPLFAEDNNGVMIDFSDWNGSAAPSLRGSLYFGINTRNTRFNNQLGNAAVLTTISSRYVTTRYDGKSFSKSFFDTGSNGLFFDADFPLCDVYKVSDFYCPATSTPLTLAASIVRANSEPVPVTFSIANARTLFAGGVNTVLPTLSGNIPPLPGNILPSDMFDWGLPFFYGRRVFFGIEGHSIQGQPNVPFYAF